MKISKAVGIALARKDSSAMEHFAMTLMSALKEVIHAQKMLFVKIKQEVSTALVNLASPEMA